MRPSAILALAAIAALGACYNYVPRGHTELTPAMYVAVDLTQDGTDSLDRYLGPNVVEVRGRFQTATDQGLLLSVWSVLGRRGDVYGWRGETVTVPREYVREVQERQTAHFKTVLLGAALLGGFVVATRAFGSGASGSAPPGGSGSGRH